MSRTNVLDILQKQLESANGDYNTPFNFEKLTLPLARKRLNTENDPYYAESYSAAVGYVSVGINVFGLPYKAKQAGPWKKYQLETISPYEIIMQFATQKSNLAMLGGYNDIVWIDFDTSAEFEKWAKKYPHIAKNTPVQSTGRGYHVGVKCSGVNTGQFCIDGKLVGDIRGMGGYVIGAPSVHPSGRAYKWLTGQSPLEIEFLRINCLDEIGIEFNQGEIRESTNPDKIIAECKIESIRAMRVLSTFLSKYRIVPENGHRHESILNAGRILGGYIAIGELELESTTERMIEIMNNWNYVPEHEVRRIFNDGLQWGIERPFESLPSTEGLYDKLFLAEKYDDIGNAECTEIMYPESFLYVPKNKDWLFYNGKFWNSESAKQLIDSACSAAIREREATIERFNESIELETEKKIDLYLKSHPELDETKISDYTKKTWDDAVKKFIAVPRAVQGFNVNVTGAMKRFASKNYTDLEKFNSDYVYFNCGNGVLNLKTLELLPHDSSQLFTYCADYTFDTAVDQTFIRDFVYNLIKPIDHDDANGYYLRKLDYLQMALGYSMVGLNKEHLMFYLYGPTRAGKSLLLKVISTVFHGVSATIDFDSLAYSSRNNGVNYDLARLVDKRFVTASESSSTLRLNSALVNRITSDNLNAQKKYGQTFEYKPQFTIWLASNHPVKTNANNDATWERLRIIECPNSFRDDPDLKLDEKLLAHSDAILTWVLLGAHKWLNEYDATGKASLKNLPDMQKHADSARVDSDTVSMFLENCCKIEDGQTISVKDFREGYINWCNDEGYTPKLGKSMNDTLERHGLKRIATWVKSKNTAVKMWHGVTIESAEYKPFNPVLVK